MTGYVLGNSGNPVRVDTVSGFARYLQEEREARIRSTFDRDPQSVEAAVKVLREHDYMVIPPRSVAALYQDGPMFDDSPNIERGAE